MADAKMKSGTFTVRNTAPGVRGFHDASDGYLELEPKGSASGVRFTEAEYESAKRAGLEIEAGDTTGDDETDDQAVVGAKAYDEITANDLRAALDEKQVQYASNADKRALYDLYTASFTAPAGGVPPVTPPPGDTLDNMSDDDLRDTVKALTGTDAPEGADREQLLKLARGEA